MAHTVAAQYIILCIPTSGNLLDLSFLLYSMEDSPSQTSPHVCSCSSDERDAHNSHSSVLSALLMSKEFYC